METIYIHIYIYKYIYIHIYIYVFVSPPAKMVVGRNCRGDRWPEINRTITLKVRGDRTPHSPTPLRKPAPQTLLETKRSGGAKQPSQNTIYRAREGQTKTRLQAEHVGDSRLLWQYHPRQSSTVSVDAIAASDLCYYASRLEVAGDLSE